MDPWFSLIWSAGHSRKLYALSCAATNAKPVTSKEPSLSRHGPSDSPGNVLTTSELLRETFHEARSSLPISSRSLSSQVPALKANVLSYYHPIRNSVSCTDDTDGCPDDSIPADVVNACAAGANTSGGLSCGMIEKSSRRIRADEALKLQSPMQIPSGSVNPEIDGGPKLHLESRAEVDVGSPCSAQIAFAVARGEKYAIVGTLGGCVIAIRITVLQAVLGGGAVSNANQVRDQCCCLSRNMG